jgi:hypothetical protein
VLSSEPRGLYNGRGKRENVMAKISIATFDEAAVTPPPAGIAGNFDTRSYYAGEADPIHLHVHRIARGEVMRLESHAIDRLAYVWQGEIEAGGRTLAQGSSLIVEHGAALALTGRDAETLLVIFAAGRVPANQRGGGHVHLLPRELVPRVDASAASSTVGGLHSDGNCPTCELWLNENTLPGGDAITPEQAQRGIHAHPHDEIIFVTGGQIRLGNRLYDKGTALAIAADTLYGFAPGPDGLTFITFRNSKSNAIRFASGGDYVESDFWKPIGESLKYLEPLEA